MGTQEAFETVTDWVVIVSLAVTLGTVYASWLATYRTRRIVPSGASRFFSLPDWAQIAAGFAITVVGLYVCYLLWIPLPLDVSPDMALVLRFVGLALTCGGEAWWFWTRWTLGAMMGLSTSSATQLQVHHRLIQNGPYALVRHPMYLGYWLLLAGLTIMYRTWTPLLILPMMIASLTRRARREEQALAATFGSEWQTYAERVPMFVPRWR